MKDFATYNKENPEIYYQFVKFAMEAKYEKGFKHYSAKGIFELIRWHSKANGTDHFKVNNNYHPYYARKMMIDYHEFKGFFRLREVKQSI